MCVCVCMSVNMYLHDTYKKSTCLLHAKKDTSLCGCFCKHPNTDSCHFNFSGLREQPQRVRDEQVSTKYELGNFAVLYFKEI